MKILIIAEHDNQTLKSVTRSVLKAAKELNGDIDVLVVGDQCKTVIDEAKTLPFITRVLMAENAQYAHQLAENVASLVATIGSQYNYILTAATTAGKNLLPRIAALLDMSMLSDVMQIISADTFVRPIYAGNILSTVQTSDKIKLLSIRATAFEQVLGGNDTACHVEYLETIIPNTHTQFVSESLTHSSRPELTAAKIIISGGRGLKSAENFKLLETIADQLGAAIGASRAAVDAGFAPNDYQVGQTGKVVAPDLYIAVGISGAIQHLAGMKDSKIIVAINSDPEAPIFQVANYAMVGDLFKILPELAGALKA